MTNFQRTPTKNVSELLETYGVTNYGKNLRLGVWRECRHPVLGVWRDIPCLECDAISCAWSVTRMSSSRAWSVTRYPVLGLWRSIPCLYSDAGVVVQRLECAARHACVLANDPSWTCLSERQTDKQTVRPSDRPSFPSSPSAETNVDHWSLHHRASLPSPCRDHR